MKRPELSTLLGTLLILLYPLLIWSAHGRLEPRQLALLLLAIGGVRLLTSRRLSRHVRWTGIAALALAAPALYWNALLPLKLYPVAISIGMLALFGYSLLNPPSMIERLARLRDPELPPFAIAYTRRVTQVWCVFFAANGAIAFATALWASPAVWSMYTGVISYVAMGVLFAGEYLVRLHVRRRHHA
ncbi:hypothetical protein J8I26_07095 [Herbaspirillum sp. LeCh32-8]|uniref:COG4648 family protein n=1 Tax=Herbaspirillum sp. LeCh32-8 TaxID=2821356 RepID=UPI001AE44B8E|nr:hypothetical protein [Herbaspirillum sp. LeCh32-8]MBP0597860.1 hypothetical protein [Herbaspirillum sp. LeCh32-8]